VAAAYRFDTPNGDKEVLPMYWDGSAWRPKAHPTPRPLYRLDELTAYPEAPVVVAEGEKDADAAARLAPYAIATTSPGGSGAAKRADWTPLQGRRVLIWPDADSDYECKGGKYADAVARLAYEAGAASVSILDPFAAFDHPENRVDGWGAADAEAEGWEPTNILPQIRSHSEPSKPTKLSFEPFEGAPTEGGGKNWPNPEPLPSARPEVEPFAPELLPETFRPWIEDVAERMQVPLDFPAVAAMVCLATVVGRQVAIRPNARDDWTVVPNLWGAVVGRPGVMKSPALAEPMRLLERLEARAREEFEAQQKEHEAEKLVAEASEKAAKKKMDEAAKKGDTETARQYALAMRADEPEAPIRRRFKTSDATVEALGELLNKNPRGLLLFRDELTGWLRGLDREGREADRAFYLEAWNGSGRYTYDRIGRGTLEIEATCVSLLGGIQPGPLSDYLRQVALGGGHDDGLLQRIQLAVWPEVPTAWRHVDRKPDKAARDKVGAVFNALDGIDPETIGAEIPEEDLPFLRFALDAQEAFVEWRTAIENRIRSGEEPPIMEAHLAKYRSLVPTLALLIHLADGGNGPVTLDATTRALAWADYLESHARRIYAPVVQPANQAAHALASKLRDGSLPEKFTAREVHQKKWSGLTNREAVQDALDTLEDLGWLVSQEEQTGGRPRTRYLINPRIQEDNEYE
jgi:putative DNA primase/helicase